MRRSSTLLIVLLNLLAAGCGYSEYPLSDAKTTVLDEDLIGTWEFEKDTQEKTRIHVGLRAGSSTEMEAVVVGVHEGRVRIVRHELRPTRIGNSRYLSIEVNDALASREPGKPRVWLPLRYRVAEGRLHLEILHPERTSDAIDAGDVQGNVEEFDISAIVEQAVSSVLAIVGLGKQRTPKEKREGAEPAHLPVLTASTNSLRTWIQGRGSLCFTSLPEGEGILRRAGGTKAE